MRTLKYREAISEGLCQAMEADPSIFITGISVDYPSGVFGTTTEALKRFGPSRVFDAPAMENALTGICIGAAAMGKRPVIVHPRADFSFLATDMLINLAAKWRYMYGGNAGSVPVVTRMIVGRGWGQGATHSQSLHALYGHWPGLNVIAPGTPNSVKRALKTALCLDQPSVILEHRALYEIEDVVDDSAVPAAPGRASVEIDGSDITIVAVSFMVQEAMSAAATLAALDIHAEIIDPVWIHPFDIDTIAASVRRTGRLLVVDTSHEACGFAGEIVAAVTERAFAALKVPPRRLALPDCPAPVAKSLEDVFYPKASTIAALVLDMLGRAAPPDLAAIDRIDSFKGPY